MTPRKKETTSALVMAHVDTILPLADTSISTGKTLVGHSQCYILLLNRVVVPVVGSHATVWSYIGRAFELPAMDMVVSETVKP